MVCYVNFHWPLLYMHVQTAAAAAAAAAAVAASQEDTRPAQDDSSEKCSCVYMYVHVHMSTTCTYCLRVQYASKKKCPCGKVCIVTRVYWGRGEGGGSVYLQQACRG